LKVTEYSITSGGLSHYQILALSCKEGYAKLLIKEKQGALTTTKFIKVI
jgi:hypothetical protein